MLYFKIFENEIFRKNCSFFGHLTTLCYLIQQLKYFNEGKKLFLYMDYLKNQNDLYRDNIMVVRF